MKIGLYGGTFDPIHIGHLILARTAMEELGLEQIVFIPAALSPHKLDSLPTATAIRWEMLCAAIAGENGFAADDLELQRTGPSYTFDTVAKYRSRGFDEIFYFIGYDNLAALATWHRVEELRKMVTFVVLNRVESDLAEGEHPYLQIARRIDVSASEIRKRVAKGRSIRYLVSQPVAEAIARHHLYQSPSYQAHL